MSSRLPEFVDPWHLASQGARFSGTVSLAELPRLRDLLNDPVGEVEFQLEFYRDDRKRARIRGSIRAELPVACQRCLGALSLMVDAKLDLAVIQVPEEAERLPDNVDPVWVEQETLRLLDLVEDELLLAIPQVPRHEDGVCHAEWDNSPAETEPESSQQNGESEKPNPFAVLADIKSDKPS